MADAKPPGETVVAGFAAIALSAITIALGPHTDDGHVGDGHLSDAHLSDGLAGDGKPAAGPPTETPPLALVLSSYASLLKRRGATSADQLVGYWKSDIDRCRDAYCVRDKYAEMLNSELSAGAYPAFETKDHRNALTVAPLDDGNLVVALSSVSTNAAKAKISGNFSAADVTTVAVRRSGAFAFSNDSCRLTLTRLSPSQWRVAGDCDAESYGLEPRGLYRKQRR